MLTLITGVAKRGQVGEAVGAALAQRGDTVLLVARDERDAQERAAELVRGGHRAVGYGCDLSDAPAVQKLADRVRHDHGDVLDALVNLAGGFAASGPLASSDPETFERQLRINLSTAYLATRAFFPQLRNGRGAVVFVASEVVLDGVSTKSVAAYAAAKAGVVALMRSVAEEGRESGVRANALAPAAIRTASNEASMGQARSYVEREDVADAIAFLCSPAAAAITGQVIRLRK